MLVLHGALQIFGGTLLGSEEAIAVALLWKLSGAEGRFSRSSLHGVDEWISHEVGTGTLC